MKESMRVKIGDFGLACLDRLDTVEKEAKTNLETPSETPTQNGKFSAFFYIHFKMDSW